MHQHSAKSSESPDATQVSGSAGQNIEWEGIHDESHSWRRQLVGEISDAFILPRYVKLFFDTWGELRNARFLELGAGNGDNSMAILRENASRHESVIDNYLATEVFADGVIWLQNRGIQAQQASAEALPFADASFDGVVEFDVMHHVDQPRSMAREMMRVGKGKLLLTESNGLSLPRKLLELLPARKAAGERSFTPGQWRAFFEGHPDFRVTTFDIYPFLFPFKVPSWLLPALVWFNHAIEKVPFFRWQCSSVVITIKYERLGSVAA